MHEDHDVVPLGGAARENGTHIVPQERSLPGKSERFVERRAAPQVDPPTPMSMRLLSDPSTFRRAGDEAQGVPLKRSC
jgi:hypothetical protein